MTVIEWLGAIVMGPQWKGLAEKSQDLLLQYEAALDRSDAAIDQICQQVDVLDEAASKEDATIEHIRQLIQQVKHNIQ